MKPSEVACRLRLDLAKVLDLYSSWNPRYRKVSPHNQWTCHKLALQCFGTDSPLAEICRITDRLLFSAISKLAAEGIGYAALRHQMSPEKDPLVVKYRKTVANKQKTPHSKPIHINPIKKSSVSTQTATNPTATA